jgi:hypothetical protein
MGKESREEEERVDSVEFPLECSLRPGGDGNAVNSAFSWTGNRVAALASTVTYYPCKSATACISYFDETWRGDGPNVLDK